MRIIRRVVVFDAADVDSESRFWAGLLGGTVHADDDWHSIVVDGEWVMGIQRSPNHIPPQWPTGDQQQQVHLRTDTSRRYTLGRLVAPRGRPWSHRSLCAGDARPYRAGAVAS